MAIESPCHGCPKNGTDKKEHECYMNCKALDAYRAWERGDHIEVAGTWMEDRIGGRQKEKINKEKIMEAQKPKIMCKACGKAPAITTHDGKVISHGRCPSCWGLRMRQAYAEKAEKEAIERGEGIYRMTLDFLKVTGSEEEAKQLIAGIKEMARKERRDVEHQAVAMLETMVWKYSAFNQIEYWGESGREVFKSIDFGRAQVQKENPAA